MDELDGILLKQNSGGKIPIALNDYIRKEESSQINDISLNLNHLEKEEHTKPQN